MAGKRQVGTEPAPVYTPATAAPELGLEEDQLVRLCDEGQVLRSDLGPGRDEDGHHKQHLYRWTPGMLERVRSDLRH
jgi:hypothetical protein